VKFLFPAIVVCAVLISARTAADVVVEGVEGDLHQNVLGHLAGMTDLECDSPDWLVRWQYRGSEETASQALEAFGYYQAAIESELSLRGQSECWQAVYRVTLNEPVSIDHVDLQIVGGLTDEPDMQIAIEGFAALNGRILNHEVYEGTKFALLEMAQLLGYFDLVVSIARIEVDPGAGTASVKMRIDSGERYHFGSISVENPVLRQHLFDEYLPFETGDPFDGRLLEKLRRDLISSDYFNRVFVEADRQALVNGLVPIRIELSPPSRKWSYSFGVGYATDTGFRVRAEADNRLVNDRGHKMSGRLLLSRELSTINAQYSVPHKDPLDDVFVFDTGYTNEDNDTVVSDLYRLGARHTYERGAGNWIETDFAEITYEDFLIGDQADTSRLFIVGTTLDYASIKDPPSRLRSGHRYSATLRGASDDLGSDANFLQLRVGTKWIFGLTERIRALVKGEAGYTLKNEIEDLPPSVRFFAGGDNSIRGYDYKRVGPRDENDDVIGGSRLLVVSGELDYQFNPSWSVAGFVDSGTAFNDSPDFHTGVGLGLRWYSPIGPLRIDVAYALDDGKGVRLHVSLGPDL
jgi:translocation and assembly module TamA